MNFKILFVISSSSSADQTSLLFNVSLNLTKDLQELTEILPGEKFAIEAKVSTPCRKVNFTLKDCDFKWEISTVDENTGQFFPLLELLYKEGNITISSQEISVGLIFVRVSVKPKEMNVPVNYDFGFIRILPRLKVTITGTDMAVKGGGPIQLYSVIQGELQDSFGNKAANVTSVWSCRVKNDSVAPNASVTFGQPFDLNTHMTSPECFDPGFLQSATDRSLVVDPDLLVSNRSYVFHVLVSQGRRFVTASHKLRVDMNVSLSIR